MALLLSPLKACAKVTIFQLGASPGAFRFWHMRQWRGINATKKQGVEGEKKEAGTRMEREKEAAAAALENWGSCLLLLLYRPCLAFSHSYKPYLLLPTAT